MAPTALLLFAAVEGNGANWTILALKEQSIKL